MLTTKIKETLSRATYLTHINRMPLDMVPDDPKELRQLVEIINTFNTDRRVTNENS